MRLFSLGSGAVRVRGFTPPAPSFSARSPVLPFDIAAGGNADITLRYAPTTATVQSGWFQILNNDSEMGNLGIWVAGWGVAAPDNPLPVLTSIGPDNAQAGGAALTLTVEGSSFVSGSVVEWNGAPRVTTYISANKLTAAITAAVDSNKPLSVVLILWSSQMGTAFDAVKSGAKSFLELLAPQDRVAVIHLETEARAVQTFSADKRQAATMIDALRAVGDGKRALRCAAPGGRDPAV